MQMSTHQNCHYQCLCLHSEPKLPPISTTDPPIIAGSPGPVSYEVTALLPGTWFTWTMCAPSKSGVSVFLSPLEFL